MATPSTATTDGPPTATRHTVHFDFSEVSPNWERKRRRQSFDAGNGMIEMDEKAHKLRKSRSDFDWEKEETGRPITVNISTDQEEAKDSLVLLTKPPPNRRALVREDTRMVLQSGFREVGLKFMIFIKKKKTEELSFSL